MPGKSILPDWIMNLSPDDPPDTILNKAIQTVPSPRQKAWQQLELTAFIHFGVNTFSNREWGTGREDPRIFNPTRLDTRQWTNVLAEAGFKQVILTVKHHDGFCLWPSRYTDFSVKGSPWRDGQGDVLREMVQAAGENELKVGVYLSPADLHEMEAPNGRYGNNSTMVPVIIPTPIPGDNRQPEKTFTFLANEYNQYYLNQLYELLTEYGPIHEVWFDGANPNPGIHETYNYEDWFSLVRLLMPQAVMFNGPDVRWVGNEAGIGRESEWSVLPFQGEAASGIRMLDPLRDDLGSRERLLNPESDKSWTYLSWQPAEMDVSIRPGWFYHPEEDGRVKPLEHLLEIYYASVGRNGVLLLNIPPDQRGLFADTDVKRLKEFGDALRTIFARDLALNAKASATSNAPAHPADCATDGNIETFWMPAEDDPQPVLTLTFDEKITFDHIVLQENISSGQRVEVFQVDAWINKTWQKIAEGTTIGYKRILHIPTTSSSRIRILINRSRSCTMIAACSLY